MQLKFELLRHKLKLLGEAIKLEIILRLRQLRIILPQKYETAVHNYQKLAAVYQETVANLRIAEADNEFIGDSSIQSLQKVSYFSRIIFWVTVTFFLVAIIWANLATLDEVTVGEGRVVPSRQIQVIQNLEGGIIQDILVHEGDIVNKGQVLMHIDDTRFASDYDSSKVKAVALQAKIERLTAEANNTSFVPSAALQKEQPDIAKSEQALYASRRSELQAKTATLNAELTQKKEDLVALQAKQDQSQENYKLATNELNLTKPLVAEGAASEVEVLRLERDVNDLKGQIATNAAAIPQAQAAITETESKIQALIAGYNSGVLAELATARKDFDSLNQTNVSLADRLARTAVRSPVKGIIKDIKYNTIGGVVQPGNDLMEIVPLDDTLLIEANIRPSDIGFLRPGQEAMVKITAYDFSIYGGLPGVLEQISADAITTDDNGRKENFYQVRIRTKRSYLGTNEHSLPIIPGMVATVNIVTGKKTVMDYILKPILKTKEYALHER